MIKYFRTLSLIAIATVLGVAANATTPTVPAVDYSGVFSAAGTEIGSQLTSNAPLIGAIIIAFAIFAFIMRWLKKTVKGG